VIVSKFKENNLNGLYVDNKLVDRFPDRCCKDARLCYVRLKASNPKFVAVGIYCTIHGIKIKNGKELLEAITLQELEQVKSIV